MNYIDIDLLEESSPHQPHPEMPHPDNPNSLFDQLIDQLFAPVEPDSDSIILLGNPEQPPLPPAELVPSPEDSPLPDETKEDGEWGESNWQRVIDRPNCRRRSKPCCNCVKRKCRSTKCKCLRKNLMCDLECKCSRNRDMRMIPKMKRIIKFEMSPFWSLRGWPSAQA